MTTIYDAAILPSMTTQTCFTLGSRTTCARQAIKAYALPQTAPRHGGLSPRTART